MSKKVKAPVKSPEFKKYWDLFVENVTSRENYQSGHLEQLRILCQLYTEFDKLTEDIIENGHTYETNSERYGSQRKVSPSCTLRDKILMEIRQYSKMLGVILAPDATKNDSEEVADEWS